MSKNTREAQTAQSVRSMLDEWYVCYLYGSQLRKNVECYGPFPSALAADRDDRKRNSTLMSKLVKVFPLQPHWLKAYWMQRDMYDTYLHGNVKIIPTKNSQ